jgi:hypothetical protein
MPLHDMFHHCNIKLLIMYVWIITFLSNRFTQNMLCKTDPNQILYKQASILCRKWFVSAGRGERGVTVSE